MSAKTLLAIPVYNEQKYVTKVLDEVRQYADDILVIDDGSSDETPMLLAKQPVDVIRHAANRGYGTSLVDAFRWSMCYRYDWVITMDCDEQHEPSSLPLFYEEIAKDDADVLSGSRYLDDSRCGDLPPEDRRAINMTITGMVNDCLGYELTDSFCGFKAYRVSSLAKLSLDETGYAFPLQFWVQSAANDLRVKEVPIRLIYNDPNRSFGGPLNDAEHRLKLYKQIFQQELAKFGERFKPCLCGQQATS